MGEKQEKVWVVMRGEYSYDNSSTAMFKAAPKPVKVFDDRKDARAYANRRATTKYGYGVIGVLKG